MWRASTRHRPSCPTRRSAMARTRGPSCRTTASSATPSAGSHTRTLRTAIRGRGDWCRMFSSSVTYCDCPEWVAMKPSRLWPRCPIVNGPPATDGRSRHTPRGWSSAATAWVAATPPAPRRAPGRVDGPTSGARAARRGPSVEVRRGSGPAPVRARGCPGCGEGTHGLPGIARSPRRARRLPVCWWVGRSPAPPEARSTFPVAAPGSSPSPLPRDGELYSGTQEVGVGPDDSGVRGIPLRPGGRDLAVRRASGEMVCRDAPEGVAL